MGNSQSVEKCVLFKIDHQNYTFSILKEKNKLRAELLLPSKETKTDIKIRNLNLATFHHLDNKTLVSSLKVYTIKEINRDLKGYIVVFNRLNPKSAAPKNEETKEDLAVSSNENGLLQRAYQSFQDANILFQAGLSEEALPQYESARSMFETILLDRSKSSVNDKQLHFLLNNLALCLDKMDRNVEALDCRLKAVENLEKHSPNLKSQHTEYYINIANQFWNLNRLKEAYKYFIAYFSISNVQALSKMDTETSIPNEIKYLNSLLNQAKQIEFYYTSGVSLFNNRDYEKAAIFFKYAFSAGKGCKLNAFYESSINNMLGKAFSALGKYPEAVYFLKEALNIRNSIPSHVRINQPSIIDQIRELQNFDFSKAKDVLSFPKWFPTPKYFSSSDINNKDFSCFENELKEHGPLLVCGHLGSHYYQEKVPSISMQTGNQKAKGWPSGAKSMNLLGQCGIFLIVNAAKVNGTPLVFFVDPQHDKSVDSLVYVVTYRTFADNIKKFGPLNRHAYFYEPFHWSSTRAVNVSIEEEKKE